MPAQYANGGPAWQFCAELDAGATPVVEDNELPPIGTFTLTGSRLYDVDGTPHVSWNWVMWDRDQAVSFKIEQLETAYETTLEAGYACTLSATSERLQMRGADDKANWLIYKDACQDGIDAGFGASTNPQPVRTMANRSHWLSNDAGKALMIGLRAWGGGLMYLRGQRADAIAAATDQPTLDAINITVWK